MYHPSAPREDHKYGGGISPVIIPPPLTPQGYPPQQRYHSPYSHSHGPDSKGGPVPWSSGLCHCCDDPANCIITAFCPCITFGQIAEIVNKGEPSCVTCGGIYGLVMGLSGLACLFSCCYRSKMRAQYDLEEYPFADCLVHFCCETCALCQEYRELKAHGFDMGIGWEANVDRQKRGIAMVAPGVVQGMSR